MELIDTHCHLDVADFDDDRDRVLANSRAAGVAAIVVPGIDAAGWPKLLRLCDAHADLYPALGLHPVFVGRHRDSDLQALERALAERRAVAVGEIGLDYHDRERDPERQRRLFAAQLAIARDAGLPVLVHVRKAHEDVLAALRDTPVPAGGIAHAFNGSL
ncbi:MAG: TatD family hydrolase, partial [Thiohalocapsa sp.]|nr:TatD family hydrolase [Thiohalocapsa sp.]